LPASLDQVMAPMYPEMGGAARSAFPFFSLLLWRYSQRIGSRISQVAASAPCPSRMTTRR
jgi:hypothetical protein